MAGKCANAYAKCQTSPIIFLTARDDTTDIVKGLEMGADDYVSETL